MYRGRDMGELPIVVLVITPKDEDPSERSSAKSGVLSFQQRI